MAGAVTGTNKYFGKPARQNNAERCCNRHIYLSSCGKCYIKKNKKTKKKKDSEYIAETGSVTGHIFEQVITLPRREPAIWVLLQAMDEAASIGGNLRQEDGYCQS